MATNQQTPVPIDRYVVIHVATTCDEHGVYVTKDSAEVIEIGWILLDAKTLDEVRHSFSCRPMAASQKKKKPRSTQPADALFPSSLQLYRESVLVKPINTPITPLCSKSRALPYGFMHHRLQTAARARAVPQVFVAKS